MYFANQIFPFNATKRRVILEKLPFKDPLLAHVILNECS